MKKVWTQEWHDFVESDRLESREGLLLLVTDISTACAEVIFRIKFSWL